MGAVNNIVVKKLDAMNNPCIFYPLLRDVKQGGDGAMLSLKNLTIRVFLCYTKECEEIWAIWALSSLHVTLYRPFCYDDERDIWCG